MAALRKDLLGIYLNDHLAILTGALALARRTAGGQSGATGSQLGEIAVMVESDRTELLALLPQLGLRRTRYKESFAVVGERLGRFKLNGAVRERSPLSSLVELDALTVAITGTQVCWQTLRGLAADEPALDPEALDAALARTGDELQRLDRLRATIARAALHPEA